jgi:hypothetical protein
MYEQAVNEFDTLSAFNTLEEAIRRITLLEQQMRNLTRSLKPYYLQGRLRTDRPIPASSADVNPSLDLLYDRVLSPSLEYILINNSGTLAWRTVTLSSF